MKDELAVAKNASKKAGEAIRKIYEKNFSVQWKPDHSPITLADVTSNDIIVSELSKSFPNCSILSEETNDDRSRLGNKWCWIVDPLDGTKEFIQRNGEFTVNIALAYNHRVVLGVIYIPMTKELYYAVRGQGAFLENDGQIQRILVSDRREKLRMVMSRSHPSTKLNNLIEKNQIVEYKKAGSSLKGCLIARGWAEVYYRFNPTMEWDTAAMQCIVEESGGAFRQMDDSEMMYNRENCLNEQGFYVLNSMDNKLRM